MRTHRTTRKPYLGFQVGQTYQNKLYSYTFCKIERFEPDAEAAIYVSVSACPEDPKCTEKLLKSFSANDFKRGWKLVPRNIEGQWTAIAGGTRQLLHEQRPHLDAMKKHLMAARDQMLLARKEGAKLTNSTLNEDLLRVDKALGDIIEKTVRW